ncbi:4'-phosphopantetheinyl transferase superfamily protein [Flavobacterium sp. GT3R68]|uniref:4'-phosphopantetheinyl transferase family protein n=1 Tax=Flavobacterium sp. GT3R68 TaxID=2594437 RepID=UPI0011869E9A|nr:hypothetical protein [Flavobacterium sp. GT3R68]TRW93923.1 hypothetical protein FNW07_03150 [Flavobacterium sp. GT3R68]
MSSLFSPNDSVWVLYAVHEETQELISKKRMSALMVEYFFNIHNKGITLNKDNDGKPHLSDSNYKISISNSKNITVCAIYSKEIGIDIEFKRKIDSACFVFLNNIYSDYISVASLEEWVKFESSLKLKGLKLESVAKKKISDINIFKGIIYKELFLDANYVAFLSSDDPIDTVNYKNISFNTLKNYVRDKNISEAGRYITS